VCYGFLGFVVFHYNLIFVIFQASEIYNQGSNIDRIFKCVRVMLKYASRTKMVTGTGLYLHSEQLGIQLCTMHHEAL